MSSEPVMDAAAQLERLRASMDAKGWVLCRLCNEPMLRVDANGDCGDCGRTLKKKYRWVRKWARRRWWADAD